MQPSQAVTGAQAQPLAGHAAEAHAHAMTAHAAMARTHAVQARLCMRPLHPRPYLEPRDASKAADEAKTSRAAACMRGAADDAARRQQAAGGRQQQQQRRLQHVGQQGLGSKKGMCLRSAAAVLSSSCWCLCQASANSHNEWKVERHAAPVGCHTMARLVRQQRQPERARQRQRINHVLSMDRHAGVDTRAGQAWQQRRTQAHTLAAS